VNRGRESGRITVPALTALLLIATGGFSAVQKPVEPEAFRIAVSVDLVEVYATVQDRKGNAVSDLRQEHFEIQEDGVRQTIRLFRHEDTPVAVGLVVDHSGSVGRKLAEVIAAARTFVEASSPEDQMFVVNFNEHVTRGLPAGVPFTSSPDELERAISDTATAGMTALYDAVFEARAHLRTASRNKKVLIVISDGGDNASAHTLEETLRMAQQSSALVYTIGIYEKDDPDRNPDVLRRLARATGGEAYFPEQLSDVIEICERIARDIRTQYTLGYVSTGTAKPGDYRKIRVSARAPGGGRLTVRARDGYSPGGPQ
jgi:VWFA-related protein